MNEETKKFAEEYLKNHPEQKVVYATSDGNLFLSIEHASDHARKVKGEVVKITAEAPADDPPADDPPADDPPADDPPADDPPADDPPAVVPPVANSATMYSEDPKPMDPIDEKKNG
jgi:hypothetical protein